MQKVCLRGALCGKNGSAALGGSRWHSTVGPPWPQLARFNFQQAESPVKSKTLVQGEERAWLPHLKVLIPLGRRPTSK